MGPLRGQKVAAKFHCHRSCKSLVLDLKDIGVDDVMREVLSWIHMSHMCNGSGRAGLSLLKGCQSRHSSTLSSNWKWLDQPIAEPLGSARCSQRESCIFP